MSVESIVDMEDLYRAAVGPRHADYYVPRFLRFDEPNASKVSWHWPAFIASSYWFLYRRMYGYWVVCCLLIPLVLAIGAAVFTAVRGNFRVALIFDLASLAFSYILIPMYANALYHRRIRRRIEAVRRRVPDPAVQVAVLESGPHTSGIGWVVLPFILLALIGLLAAIAIPAYQDYAQRAQVTEV